MVAGGSGGSGAGAPAEVVALAERRAEARAARDFARADALRDEVAAAGWVVVDEPDGGWRLETAAPFTASPRVSDLLAAAAPGGPVPAVRRCGVGLVVDGWPDDVEACVEAVLSHAPTDVVVVALDLGDVDGAGRRLAQLADDHPGRVEAHHVTTPCGWGEARAALLALDRSGVHVVADLSSRPTGDAVTPLLEQLDAADDVVAAGWRGVDPDGTWRDFVEHGPEVRGDGPHEVSALLGYWFAVRRDAALATGPPARARYYRNADMEWTLALRDAGLPAGMPGDGRQDGRAAVRGDGRPTSPARCVAVPDLPLEQARHHGYHDAEPGYRDKQSRKNYQRILSAFRGRDDLRVR